MLYIVGTPIGNLQDISPRALETLKNVDIIACEDTRRASILLNHFGITGKRLLAHHQANERQSAGGLVKLLEEGQAMAYVSDGGMPTISDPGYLLVKAALEAGIPVTPIGGITAAATALAASGLPAARHIFAGFLPRKKTEQAHYIQSFMAQNLATALVFYESPNRILKTLTAIAEIAPNAPCVLARELTKVHEEFRRGTVIDLLESYGESTEEEPKKRGKKAKKAKQDMLKGEFTVILAQPEEE